jgi:hypothetical protein
MVFQLLSFCGGIPEKGTTGDHQVGTCIIKGLVDQEILLFDAQSSLYLFYVLIEKAANLQGR